MTGFTDQDRDALIRTMLGEAGGEGDQGMMMVGNVVMNRQRDSRWGGSIYDVVHAPQQFSTWNSGAGGNNPNRYTNDSPAYQRAASLADQLLSGQVGDLTGGATHYYSPSGMNALVEDGSQRNSIPGWLQDETNRRGGNTVTHGGHIFTGLASNNGSPSLAGGRGNDQLGAGPMSGYNDPGRPLSPQEVEAQSAAQRPPLPAWLEKLQPKWMTPDRSQQLLAIGAGLLSGDDWASGIGNAASGLGDITQEQKQRDLMAAQRSDDIRRDEARYTNQVNQEQNNALRDQGFAMERLDASAANDASARPKAVYNLLLDDGSILGVGSEQNGRIYSPDDTDVTARVKARANNSTVDGGRGQLTGIQATEIGNGLVDQSNSIKSYDNLYRSVSSSKYGVSGLMTDINAFVNTLASNGMTPEALARAINEGNQQALIGSMKGVTGNTGVMTDQDFLHLMTAMGGDLSKIGTNPEAVLSMLSTFRGKALEKYNQSYDQFSATSKANPQNNYIVPERYVEPEGLYAPLEPALDPSNGPGALSGSQQPADSPPPGYEETWAKMTPQAKARVLEKNKLTFDQKPTESKPPEGAPQEVIDNWQWLDEESRKLWLR